jgi:hypothetical protein
VERFPVTTISVEIVRNAEKWRAPLIARDIEKLICAESAARAVEWDRLMVFEK